MEHDAAQGYSASASPLHVSWSASTVCPMLGVIRNLPRYSYDRDSHRSRRALQKLLPGLGAGPVLLYQGGFWPGYDF